VGGLWGCVGGGWGVEGVGEVMVVRVGGRRDLCGIGGLWI